MSATNADTQAGQSTSTFVTALVTSAIILGAQGAIFLYFHNRQKRIYQPRTFLLQDASRRPPELPSNPIKWLLALVKIDPHDVLASNGLDAYVFVRLLRMGFYMFLPAWFLTWVILMPVTAVKPNQGQTGLSMFVIGNVGTTVQARLGAHCAVAIVLVLFWFYLIYLECVHFVHVRHEYLSSPEYQNQARARTVLVTKIPKDNMNEAYLKELASEHGTVDRVWLVRDVKAANEAYDDRQKACTKLEAAVGKIVQLANKRVTKGKATLPTSDGAEAEDLNLINSVVPAKKRPTQRLGKLAPICIGRKVDAIDHNTEEITRTEGELKTLRAEPEKFDLATSAILRFTTQAAAVNFAQAPQNVKGKATKVTGQAMGRYKDIAPEHIFWPNLGLNSKVLPGRVAAAFALTGVLIIFWAIPVAFAGSLSNLSSLCSNVSFLSWVCTLPSPVVGIIQGAFPPIFIAILFMLLPIILRIFCKIQGLPTTTLLDQSVYSKYYLFLMIHGFLIVTISSSLASALPDAINNPGQAPSLLATKLPQSSIYFLTFVITSAFGAAAGYLFQVVPVIKLMVFRYLGGSTPRKIYNLERVLPTINYVQLLPNVLLLAALGTVYCVLQPVMAALATVAFGLYLMSFKYLFVYSFDQPISAETGGSYFSKSIKRFFVGFYIMELCLIGLFFLSSDENNKRSAIAEGVLMVVLLVLTVAYQLWLQWKFRPDHIVLEKVSGAKEPSSVESYKADKEEVHDNQAIKEAHGFEPPSMWAKQPVIWLARDPLGLTEREERKIKEAGIVTSSELATMDNKGRIDVQGDPSFINE